MIQPGKILIFEEKPEISLKVGLFGVGKKFLPFMQGFPNSVKGWGEVNCHQWSGENWKFYRRDFCYWMKGT